MTSQDGNTEHALQPHEVNFIDHMAALLRNIRGVAGSLVDCNHLDEADKAAVGVMLDNALRARGLLDGYTDFLDRFHAAERVDAAQAGGSRGGTADEERARALLATFEAGCVELTERECVEELARGEWDVQKVIPAGLGDPTDVGVNYTASHGWTLKGLRCQVALERFKEALLPPEESRVESAELENELAQSLEEASAYITQAPGLDSAPAKKLRTAITMANALIAALQDCADEEAA